MIGSGDVTCLLSQLRHCHSDMAKLFTELVKGVREALSGIDIIADHIIDLFELWIGRTFCHIDQSIIDRNSGIRHNSDLTNG